MRYSKRAVYPVAVTVFALVAITIAIGLARHFADRASRPGVGSNMHTLQLAVERFSQRTGGYYPDDINTTVEEVLKTLGKHSNDPYSIAGARGCDSVKRTDIGSTGPAMLPDWFRNPFYGSRPAIATSLADPPTWLPGCEGIVFYVPLDVDGSRASGYRIYGGGPNGLRDMVLSSEE